VTTNSDKTILFETKADHWMLNRKSDLAIFGKARLGMISVILWFIYYH